MAIVSFRSANMHPPNGLFLFDGFIRRVFTYPRPEQTRHLGKLKYRLTCIRIDFWKVGKLPDFFISLTENVYRVGQAGVLVHNI